MSIFQINIGEMQREDTSVVELQSIFLNIETSIEDKIVSNFISLKVKTMMSKLIEEGYEHECTQHLYSSCMNYLDM